MNVMDLYNKFDKKIPSEFSCSWDNDGLMCCPDPQREVKKVLITLDVTEASVDYAVKYGFDTIISHHPVIFYPLKSLVSPKLIKLIKNNITVMSFHTRLDKLEGGVNCSLAEKLGLENTEQFSKEGIGLIGNLKKSEDLETFSKNVKESLGSPIIELVSSDKRCYRVAIVGGDGKDFLMDAFNAGCDTYLTGSMSYNSLTDASALGINVIAAGHFYTENPVIEKLKQMVKNEDENIYCELFYCNIIKIL